MKKTQLGFGFMRLPMETSGTIDLKTAEKMTDEFLNAGFTYFDTAFIYHGGKSEETLRKVLTERHARENFQVADKFTLKAKNEFGGDLKKMFQEQLHRTGLTYFDAYLMHAMDRDKITGMDQCGGWDFMQDLKENGLARKIGFSFHDSAEILDKILTDHPVFDFVQLQINFIDWDSGSVQSRLCWQTARKHGLPVVVMEPLKGGMLSGSFHADAEKILRKAAPERSNAEWAFRFLASQDGIQMILSGMSTPEQVRQNVHLFRQIEPLTPEDLQVLDQAAQVLKKIPRIPCTGCQYCVGACPRNIPIPNLINVANNYKLFGDCAGVRSSFAWYARNKKPSDCITCWACAKTCPQHINIPEELKQLKTVFE